MEEFKQQPYREELQGHKLRWFKFVQFTQSSTKAAGIMLLAAIMALMIANSVFYDNFLAFWHADVLVQVGSFGMEMTLSHVINDVLMAIFFLLVGLEIKYELVAGELTDIRNALLPIIAALGGVLAPIGIYLFFNAGHDTFGGWGVPTATDIAFALGVLALLGDKIPNGLRVFLSTLAVADDIIAIIVIAIFYGHTPSFIWLALAGVVLVILIMLNRANVYSIPPYIFLGVILWYFIFMSGIHSTIAGVLLAFTIPTTSQIDIKKFSNWGREKIENANAHFEHDVPVIGQRNYLRAVRELSQVSFQVVPPAVRLERGLSPWVNFLILPLFALTNADVAISGAQSLTATPVFPGIMLGLLIGKPLGIMLFSFLVVKLKISQLPTGVDWVHMLGAAILGGVGFTMAIFVANLAFDDLAIRTAAKAGVLAGSVVAGLLGFIVLLIKTNLDARKQSATS